MNTLRNRTVVVACGVGRDSVGMLVGLHDRGIRPAAILFADVGGEKQGTYAFIPYLQTWLARVGFPQLTTVRYTPRQAPYTTLEGNMLSNATLPGAAFNRGSCTLKFKVEPQNRWCRQNTECRLAWARGERVLKLIGFEACEGYRQKRAADRVHAGQYTKPNGKPNNDGNRYQWEYPLMDWGWSLDRCKQAIADAGMPVPPKSACFFCPNQRPAEVENLSDEERARIMHMELRAEPYNRKVHGLWRRPRRTMRLPGSMTEYILNRGLAFVPLNTLEVVPLNPRSKKGRDGCTFRPPHRHETLREKVEAAGHALPTDCEDELHLSLIESLQLTLF
jgi:hypothetical protein